MRAVTGQSSNPKDLCHSQRSHTKKQTDGDLRPRVNTRLIGPNVIVSRKNYMNIKLYSIITCQTCLLVKSKFDAADIDYTLVDGDQHPDETEEVMKLTGSVILPIVKYTLEDEDHYIIGYDEDNLDKLIKLC